MLGRDVLPKLNVLTVEMPVMTSITVLLRRTPGAQYLYKALRGSSGLLSTYAMSVPASFAIALSFGFYLIIQSIYH